MLDHVSLGVTDIERSRRFYDAILRPLGLVRIVDFGDSRGSDYGAAPGSLGVEFTITREAEVRTPIPGAHVCFRAPDRAAVDAFHAAALRVAGATTARPAFGRTITPTITAPSCWIPMVIASRRSATRRPAQPSSLRASTGLAAHQLRQGRPHAANVKNSPDDQPSGGSASTTEVSICRSEIVQYILSNAALRSAETRAKPWR